jgi:hypothetical protein
MGRHGTCWECECEGRERRREAGRRAAGRLPRDPLNCTHFPLSLVLPATSATAPQDSLNRLDGKAMATMPWALVICTVARASREGCLTRWSIGRCTGTHLYILGTPFSNIVRNFKPSAATSDGPEGRGASVVGVLHTSLQARL